MYLSEARKALSACSVPTPGQADPAAIICPGGVACYVMVLV
jgi:hypothetical protein